MPRKINQAVIVVLDGFGVGEAADAREFGDEGSNTLRSLLRARPNLAIPNLVSLGLGQLIQPSPLEAATPRGAYGRMQEASRGKDTTTGHWELMGVISKEPFPVYPDGFPAEVLGPFQERIGRGVLGNKAASGTVIIEELGEEHLRTKKPIVYTSADSVFQIAAHEEVIPVDELYDMCRIARDILQGPHGVARVIARPFIGRPGSFKRTDRRRDFSLPPPSPTLLDIAQEAGLEVVGVGKIDDIFAHRGLHRSIHVLDHRACIDGVLESMAGGAGLILANLVEFDMLYGHRNDVDGYADALEELDSWIPELIEALREDALLVFTADHGCDPSFPGSDHTRENVPLLCYSPGIRPVDLGLRSSFADLAATLADLLQIPPPGDGPSFAQAIL